MMCCTTAEAAASTSLALFVCVRNDDASISGASKSSRSIRAAIYAARATYQPLLLTRVAVVWQAVVSGFAPLCRFSYPSCMRG
jgi:hypothetical protein